MTAAQAVGSQSEGAYDVTVAPLVERWGFGADGPVDAPPGADEIAALKDRVGQQLLAVDGEHGQVMKRADVSVDLSSIAKGYGVDVVADWLLAQGFRDFLVEVGGEIRVAGNSHRGDAWRVAIEQPEPVGRGVAAALTPGDAAVATSGDYRNFFEIDGRRYSHSIDPRTGYPVVHDLVSVTVVHPSAMLADAWATALIVLGAEAAERVARQRELAVYFIRRTDDGYSSGYTAALEPYLLTGG